MLLGERLLRKITSTFHVLPLLHVWFCWVEMRGKNLEIDVLADCGEKHADVPHVLDVPNGKGVVLSSVLQNGDVHFRVVNV